MKTKLFFWHSRLIRAGYFNAARLILRRMLHSNGSVVTIEITDGDDEAYESGLADWLQKYSRWNNRKYGFVAYLNI